MMLLSSLFFQIIKMSPHINPSASGYQITPLDGHGTKEHLNSVALELGVLGCDKSFADVTIHCRDKSSFKVNTQWGFE